MRTASFVYWTVKLPLMSSTVSYFQEAVRWAPLAGSLRVKERIHHLRTLKKVLLAHRIPLQQALQSDLGRAATETDVSELFATTALIDYVIQKLPVWAQKEHVSVPMTLWPSSASIVHESKGAVLILAPWNYPVSLCLSPLVYALAGGNSAVVKPSEMAPASASVVEAILSKAFPEGLVQTVLGDASVAQSLLTHPWNHIFFTGGPSIGKKVMAAASQHLTSVTLELGGKSPVVLDEHFPLQEAGKLLAWAKSMNAGQVCIAPDYVLVPRKLLGPLVHAFADGLKALYGEDLSSNPDYPRIIHRRHFDRLMQWHEEASRQSDQVWQPAVPLAEDLFFPPTVYIDPSPACALSCEEIFGPLLPLVPYDTLEDALAYIQGKERPLALYILSHSSSFQERVMRNTRAGATVINDFIIHYMHPELPFGGVNHSGIGKSHGVWGFREFTNARSVIKRRWNLHPTMWLGPPYTGWKKKVVDLLVKYG